TRRAGGRWSRWIAAPYAHGHEAESGGARRLLTDPVWTGPADGFELRSSRELRGAQAHFVRTGSAGSARASAVTLAQPQLAAGPGQPPIIARSSWATAACRPRRAAYFGEVDVAFVHHTAGANFYGRRQSAAIVRAICLFHRNVRGWNDVGYNFLVDRYGQIFEGRAGGIDEPLAGAQAGGYNLVSTGIAMIGTFDGFAPSRRALDALAHLIAWKLSLHGVDARGRTTVQVSPYGSGYSRYPAGAQVRLHRVAGHRDGDTTSCPGNALYRRLPAMRRRAAALQGPLSGLAAQRTAAQFAYPSPASLSGVLTSNGQPMPGAQIELQQRTVKGERTLATAATGDDGSWSAGATVAHNANLRALYRGAPGVSAVVSPAIAVAIAPQVTLSGDPQQTTAGGVVQFSGTIAPAKAKVTLVVSQLQLDGTWSEVRTVRFAAAGDGTFTRVLGFAEPGQYQVVAHTPADDRNATGTSAAVAITVA
ncbi:MAG: peptidoglycan recognition protein, partial [Thermoleophilaceae bacterium]